jgi:hypothetical protein
MDVDTFLDGLDVPVMPWQREVLKTMIEAKDQGRQVVWHIPRQGTRFRMARLFDEYMATVEGSEWVAYGSAATRA